MVPKVEVANLDKAMLPSELVRPTSFRNIEPVPVRSVPLTHRLEAKVEVEFFPVPLTSRKPAMVEVLRLVTERLVIVVVPS